MVYKLFKNRYLDKISNGLRDYELAIDLRKFGTGKTRSEIADILQLSIKTISRYESPVNRAKIPFSYFVALRFMSGDLSYFGNYWDDTRIDPWTKLLRSPYDKYKAFKPMDLNSQTNFIYQTAMQEKRKVNDSNRALLLRVKALETENSVLTLALDRAIEKDALKSNLNKQISLGKVLEFKRRSLI